MAVDLLKLALLEAAAILALVDPLVRRARAARRPLALAYATLAALAALAFVDMERFHGGGSLPHWNEQFHFDLGDKYLREVRYDALYPATSAVVHERGLPRSAAMVRDTSTFAPITGFELLAHEQEAKGRFTAERWRAFGDDLAALLAEDRGAASTDDHGNTASPSGALGPWLLMQVVPLRRGGFTWLACADLAALLVAFLACWRFASLRVASLTFVVLLLPPNVSGFLLGSLARFDWLVAAVLATLALHRRRWGWAGGLFAFAALARPFAAGFAICAGLALASEVYRGRVARRDALRFAVSLAATALVLVLVSSVVFGWTIWPAYATRTMATVREGYYEINHGLRDVWAQIARDGAVALVRPAPSSVAAAAGTLGSPAGFGVLRVVLGTMLLVACARDGAVMGSGLGVLYVFATVVTNAYYQSMWAVLALACALHPDRPRARVGLALVCAMFGLRWVAFLCPELAIPPHYFASWTSFAFAVIWVGLGLLSPPLAPRSSRSAQSGSPLPSA